MKHLAATLCVCVLLLSLPSSLLAQPDAKAKAPETLLPADVLAFVRYDGYETHRGAYDKTTLAKVMKDDLGEFFEYLTVYLRDVFLETVPNDKAKVQHPKEKAIAEMDKFIEYFWKHGVLVGLESPGQMRGAFPLRRVGIFVPDEPDFPGMQATFVFPQGGLPANRAVIQSFLLLVTDTAGVDIIEKKEGGRTYFGGNQFNWWQEGDHVVLRVGTKSVKQAIDVIEGRKPNLTTTPLFKKLTSFKSYETDVRGLVDLERAIDLLRAPNEGDSRVHMILTALERHFMLQYLGANGLEGLTFHMGFAGKYQRSTVNLHVVDKKERSGLLKALTNVPADAAKLDFATLPALPADAANISVYQLDLVGLYDFVMQTAKLIALAQALPEGRLPELPDLDVMLRIDFRNDFLASLDSTAVLYNAHSEGPFFLGQGLAFKVKDAKKLTASLQTLTKTLNEAGLGVHFEKKTYRGVEMQVLTGDGAAGFSLPVTYTLHKDWLVVGVFPQSVKGYILRSEPGRKKWQAPAHIKEILAQSIKENPGSRLAGIETNDPAVNFEIGLAILPTIAHFGSMAAARGNANLRFDVSKIPSAQGVNEHLYPSTTLFFDDGNTLRWEKHYSIDMPVGGAYMMISMMSGLFRVF